MNLSSRRPPLREPLVVRFDVAGVPVAQGSKTIVRAAERSWMRDANDARLRPWRSAVAACAAESMDGLAVLHGPVRLHAEFRFPRPRSHFGSGRNAGQLRPSAPIHHKGAPDLDKLLRSIGDAIAGIVVVNDAQIVSVSAAKAYGQPGATVRVEEVRA